MKKKKIPKDSRRRLIVFGTISLIVIGYFIFSITYYSMNIYHLQKEEKLLNNQLNTLKYDEKLLKVEIEKLKDPEYLARYARENYLYSKNGEIVIKVQKEETKESSLPQPKNDTFLIFIGILILLFIVGYVIKRSKTKESN